MKEPRKLQERENPHPLKGKLPIPRSLSYHLNKRTIQVTEGSKVPSGSLSEYEIFTLLRTQFLSSCVTLRHLLLRLRPYWTVFIGINFAQNQPNCLFSHILPPICVPPKNPLTIKPDAHMWREQRFTYREWEQIFWLYSGRRGRSCRVSNVVSGPKD